MEGKENQAEPSLPSGLTGLAWTTVEPMLSNLKELDQLTSWKMILAALDTPFKYDVRTEMPDRFEDIFYMHARRSKETLFDHVASSRLAEQRAREDEVQIPTLTTAGCCCAAVVSTSRSAPYVVLNQVGRNISFDSIVEAMYPTFRQDPVVDVTRASRAAQTPTTSKTTTPTPTTEPPTKDNGRPTAPTGWMSPTRSQRTARPTGTSTMRSTRRTSTHVAECRIFARRAASSPSWPWPARKEPPPSRLSRRPPPLGAPDQDPRRARRKEDKNKGQKGGDPTRPVGKGSGDCGRSATGRQTCLKRGQVGHWARNSAQRPLLLRHPARRPRDRERTRTTQ